MMTSEERDFIATIVRIHAKIQRLKARLASDGFESLPSVGVADRASH